MADYSRSIQWLLHSDDPSVKFLAFTELYERSGESDIISEMRRDILKGPRVRALLSGQQEDGGFGRNPYLKWTGAHWRLVSLVNLAIPPDNINALLMAEHVLKWIYGHAERGQFPVKNNLARMHASVYGNPVGACSYLGMARDQRVRFIVRLIIKNQWPDGGWNCDPKPEAEHSSFHESLATLWGLVLYHKATGDDMVKKAIDRTCELFLNHHIFRSHKTGKVINGEFLKLRYPVYWHYNFLEAMRVLSLAGKAGDERMAEALDFLEEKCSPDGKWRVEGTYWRPPDGAGKHRASQEVVDWRRSGFNEMITLNALRVLKASGRVQA